MRKFTQLIRFGEYTQNQKTRVIDFISNLIIEDKKEYKITVEQYKENKTLEQLGYYWSTIVPVCMDWQGLVKDDADIWLKEKCAIPRVLNVMGEVFQVRASIAKMKIDEMSRYIDDCINFMGAQGYYVPPPTYKER
jgi:hypothetical protein